MRSSQNLKILNSKNGPFLKGKVVLVNGLSSDIGIKISEALLENGAFIAGTYNKNKGAIDLLVKKYGKRKLLAYQLDLTTSNYAKKVGEIVQDIFSKKKKIDILINVSGIWMLKPFLYETPKEMEKIWRINYEGHVVFSQEVIRKMLSTGGGGGEIINIASTGGIRGSGQLSTYCASKAALINLTKSLAEEFGPRNIKVNSVSPGLVETKALDKYYDEVSKELMIKNIPRSRLCTPLDVANAVLGILINDYMTGNDIILHGGKL